MRDLAGISLLVFLSSSVLAQTAGAAPAFAVADVHVSPKSTIPPFLHDGYLVGDRYVLRQATMLDLIATAYGLDDSNVKGGPTWLEWDRFDVIANAPPATSPATLRLMLRSLLAERFKLVAHNGSAPMPSYVLTTGKNKAKMKESEGTGDAGCKPQPPPVNPASGAVPYVMVSCHNMTMQKFAENMHMMAGAHLDEPVVDSTGLKGSWDFDIKWTARPLLQKAGADGISIFDALDKELGLKLTLQMVSRPVLLVDSVNEIPTANPPGLEKSLHALPPAHFEVAVIKPARPDERVGGNTHNGQLDLRGVTLKFLITFAWDLNPNDSEVLVGAPPWLNKDRYDIRAKSEGDDTGGPLPKTPQVDRDELQEMLRGLLADRFSLKTHTEDRPVTAYTLVAVSPKLRRANPLNRTRCTDGPGPDGKDPRLTNPVLNKLVTCQNMTMTQFGEELRSIASDSIHSPVLDATGLKGSWDFSLSFSSADRVQPGGGTVFPADGALTPSDPNGAVSVFDAVRRQLGLKLEKQRRSMPVFVIDHMDEQPTPN